jgi:mono/diheme cytochrome c family protein
MPASPRLFETGATASGGPPAPTVEALRLVAYLQALGRGRRDAWAEFRRRDPLIPPPPAGRSALLQRGRLLYGTLCSTCHGRQGDGQGPAAALLSPPPRDLAAAHYRFKSTPGDELPRPADLYRVITLGTGIGSAMPSFHWLPPPDRWALVFRVQAFSRRPWPAPSDPGATVATPAREPRAIPAPPSGADLSEGRRLWDALGCASCHGAAGEGLTAEQAGMRWSGADGPPLRRSGRLTHACDLKGGASGEALLRAVLGGVGVAMPAYGEALPDPATQRALRDYLLSLQQEPEGP